MLFDTSQHSQARLKETRAALPSKSGMSNYMSSSVTGRGEGGNLLTPTRARAGGVQSLLRAWLQMPPVGRGTQ